MARAGAEKLNMIEPIQYSAGRQVCWGAKEEWLTLPIANLPPDTLKVKRRVRSRSYAVAFVSTRDRTEQYYLCPKDDGKLELGWRVAANRREETKRQQTS